MNLNVLVACEESQAVTKQFRALGHNAYSCDIKPTSGENPEWHIQGDALQVAYDESREWDLMIAHPPCTYLAVSGARWLYNKDGSKNQERWDNREQAMEFVMALANAPIEYICIENPVSQISSLWRKPDQIVQPYMFGDEASKRTCLWTKNLPSLVPTDIVGKGEMIEWEDHRGRTKRQPKWYYEAFAKAKTPEERRTIRSKFFEGMACAMAVQYSNAVLADYAIVETLRVLENIKFK